MDGLPITGYKYALSVSTNSGSSYGQYGDYVLSSWTSGTTFTITGLTNGYYYKVKIRAVNALGDGAESAEIGAFVPNTVPGTPAAATLTAGDATDTFTWSAPASNGSTITKYAYQISTDNGSNWYSAIGGTLNGETETANLSVVLNTQYSLSSYKLRVRAFNNGTNGGWSERSTISSSGTAVWTSSGTSVSPEINTCPAPNCDGGCTGPDCSGGCTGPDCSGGCGSCTCGACADCGTVSVTGSPGTRTSIAGTRTSIAGTRTVTSIGTQSRTCYRWTRTSTGSTASGYIYDQNSTNPCSSTYSACTAGTCSGCSAGSCSGCSAGSCSGCSAGTCGCTGCGTSSGTNIVGTSGQGGPFYVPARSWWIAYNAQTTTYVWSDSAGTPNIGCNSGAGLAGPSQVFKCSVGNTAKTNAAGSDACRSLF